jgi:hypothetical protein
MRAITEKGGGGDDCRNQSRDLSTPTRCFAGVTDCISFHLTEALHCPSTSARCSMGLVDYASDSESEPAPAIDHQHGKRPKPDGGGDPHREQEQVTTKRSVVSPSCLLLCWRLIGH